MKAIGTLPGEISRLSTLTTINIEGQALRGPLPNEWFDSDSWPQLQNMFLSNNPIGGTLPDAQSGSLRSLNQLRINNCTIGGPLPKTWGRDETSMRRLSVL